MKQLILITVLATILTSTYAATFEELYAEDRFQDLGANDGVDQPDEPEGSEEELNFMLCNKHCLRSSRSSDAYCRSMCLAKMENSKRAPQEEDFGA